MQVQIIKSFQPEDSPRPLLVNELVTVSDSTAKQWIEDGRAVALRGILSQGGHNAPRRAQREKAVTV